LVTNPRTQQDSHRTLPSLPNDRWEELCALYLPVTCEGEIWRYSRAAEPGDPWQGWKLHISATVLTANKVLEKIGPFLRARRTLFKGPVSLQELSKLNSGLCYGYTQVGKCLTVYPETAEEAVALAERLHELTRGIPAPAVPFDLRFRPGSCVHYRFGAFKHQEIENEEGAYVLALRAPEGRLVPDERASAAKPDWVSDPFSAPSPPSAARPAESPLATTFLAFRAITQRGKGGVYQALDLSADPPRLCILKEGRRDGEPDWDGRDGRWRVRNEEKALAALCASGVKEVPRVYASFEVEGHFYLATEFIEGVSLQALLSKRLRRLPVGRALRYGVQLSRLLSRIHSAGWAWQDCKPSNLIVTREGALRPVDFEGACSVNRPRPIPWVTHAFTPPEFGREPGAQPRAADDLYALGVVIYQLLSGILPSMPEPAPLGALRRNVPAAACRIVSGLLDADPRRRPAADNVARGLQSALTPGVAAPETDT
jgi:hypothetical protein